MAGATLRTLGPATSQSFNISSPIVFWIVAGAAAVYAVFGLLLARRLPRHAVPWLFAGIGLSAGGVIFTWAYAIVASSAQPSLPGVSVAALFNAAILQPVVVTLMAILLFVFPDERPIDMTSRRVVRVVPSRASCSASAWL